MEQMSFYELAIKMIEEEKRPLSAEEIWNIAINKGYDQRIKSKGKTPWASIGALIYVDMRDNKKTPFIKANTRPTKFYLKSLQNGKDVNEFSSEELV